MFSFQRLISQELNYVDNIYLEDEYLGTLGYDEDALWMKINRDLTLGELNLLISQLILKNNHLILEKIEIIKINL